MTQQILSRHGEGDWGAKRRLIAALYTPGVMRDEAQYTTKLFVVPGHTAPHGARGFGRDYHPAALVLRAPSRTRRGSYDTIWLDKGRVSKATLAKHADKINAAFGFDIVSRLDPSKTLWVNEQGEAI